jgi:uncharacterized protein (DUF3084 family)
VCRADKGKTRGERRQARDEEKDTEREIQGDRETTRKIQEKRGKAKKSPLPAAVEIRKVLDMADQLRLKTHSDL